MGKNKKDAAKKEARAAKQAQKALKGERKLALKIELDNDGISGEDVHGFEEDDLESLIYAITQKEKLRTTVTVNISIQPSARSNFSMCSLPSGDILMFGGEFCDGETTIVYNDLHKWNLSKNEWKSIQSLNTPPPTDIPAS